MTEENPQPERRANMNELYREFKEHVSSESEWQDKLWKANSRLRDEVADLNEHIQDNKKHLADMQEDIGDLLTAWEGLQGALKFFGVMGHVAKWFTAIGAAIAMIWYFFTHLSMKGGS